MQWCQGIRRAGEATWAFILNPPKDYQEKTIDYRIPLWHSCSGIYKWKNLGRLFIEFQGLSPMIFRWVLPRVKLIGTGKNLQCNNFGLMAQLGEYPEASVNKQFILMDHNFFFWEVVFPIGSSYVFKFPVLVFFNTGIEKKYLYQCCLA